MMRGHKAGCRCVGCSPATRARGMRSLRSVQRRRRFPRGVDPVTGRFVRGRNLPAVVNPRRGFPLSAPIYQTRERRPKWTVPVGPLMDPMEGGRILRQRFRGWTKGQHIDEALTLGRRSIRLYNQWVLLGNRALRTYGEHGALVAGVLRDHFPEATKTRLRTLAHGVSEARGAALAHWRAAGKRGDLFGDWPRFGARTAPNPRRRKPAGPAPRFGRTTAVKVRELTPEEESTFAARAGLKEWGRGRMRFRGGAVVTVPGREGERLVYDVGPVAPEFRFPRPHERGPRAPDIAAEERRASFERMRLSPAQPPERVTEECGRCRTVTPHLKGSTYRVCTVCEKITGRNRQLSRTAEAFIRRHIRRHLRDYGMGRRQAVRVAYEEAAGKGYRVPAAPNPRFSSGVTGPGFHQEWYETGDPDTQRRARQLRRLGYAVYVQKMGTQITSVGRVRMTLLTARWGSGMDAPPEPNPLTPGEVRIIRASADRHERAALPMRPESYGAGLQHGMAAAERAIATSFGEAMNPLTRLRGTLAAWIDRTGAYVQHHSSGAVAVYEAHRLSKNLQWDLYHLADYAVSSVSGPVTWLVRRNPLTRQETVTLLRGARAVHSRLRGRHGSPGWRGFHIGQGMTLERVAREYGVSPSRGAWGIRWPAVPNPPRIVGTIPGTLTEIRYTRTGRHRGPYYHKFSRGVRAYRVSDGTVLLRGRKPLWVST